MDADLVPEECGHCRRPLVWVVTEVATDGSDMIIRHGVLCCHQCLAHFAVNVVRRQRWEVERLERMVPTTPPPEP